MKFFTTKHNTILYNRLLVLSRNIFFYKTLNFKDNFESRIYLMFIHYSIILIIYKYKNFKIDQSNYNNLFILIENYLREEGFGDIAVNQKMKNLNKIFYDILLKINVSNKKFTLNKKLMISYFSILGENEENLNKCTKYFSNFYQFCFDISPENMLEEIKNFNY